MMDKIFIEGLEARCLIGTSPRERVKKQRLLIDLEFQAPVQKPAKSDDLRDAFNYQRIADRTSAFVFKSHFYLIETLAERLAATLRREFKLKKLRLRIRKPEALRNAKNAGVEIFRK